MIGSRQSSISIKSRLLMAVCVAFASTSVSHTATADTDFYKDVFPSLKANCVACHNKTKKEGGLNLETPESIVAGGDTGPGAVPGKSAESLILQAARRDGDVVMPPDGNKIGAVPLSAKEMTILAAWIDAGAKTSIREQQKIRWKAVPESVQPVYSVAVTKDGRWGASGRANQIDLYDLATETHFQQLIDANVKVPGQADGKQVAHHDAVQSIAFSADGKRMASSSFREVKIWQNSLLATQSAVIPGSVPDSIASTISLNGLVQVSLKKDGTLVISKIDDNSVISQIAGISSGEHSKVSLAPDSTLVAVTLADGNVGLWNIKDGAQIGTISISQPVKFIGWKADSKGLFLAGHEKAVFNYQIAQGAEPTAANPAEFPVEGTIKALAVATNPDRLVVASENGQVRTFNIADAKQLHQIAVAAPVALGISNDGAKLATGSADGLIQVWNLKDASKVSDLVSNLTFTNKTNALNWELARNQLESDFQKSEVTRLEAQNKNMTEVLKKAKETIDNANKVIPDKQKASEKTQAAQAEAQKAVDEIGAKIAAGDAEKPDAELAKQKTELEKKLTESTTANNAALATLTESQNHLKDATAEQERAMATQERNLAAIEVAKQAGTEIQKEIQQATTDFNAAKAENTKRKPNPLTLTFSPSGQSLAAVYADGEERAWSVKSATPLATIPAGTSSHSATSVSISDGAFMTCFHDGSRQMLQTSSPWVLERVIGGATSDSPFVDRVNAVAFSPNGKILAAGGGAPSRGGDISLWDVDSGEAIATWNECHADCVVSLDFSTDGTQLASGGADKLARVFEVATGKVLGVYEGHTHHVLGVTLRADGRVMATAGADGVVLIWNLVIGERKSKITGWNKEVTGIQFLGATNQAVTSSGDHLLRTVNDAGGQVRVISNVPGFLHATAYPTFGTTYLSGGEDGVVRIWDSTSGKELFAFPAK